MNLVDALLPESLLETVGDRPALTGSAGTLTYNRLVELIDGCAHVLAEQAIDRRIILLVMRDSPLLMATFLGAVKAGVVPVFVSPRLPAADVASIAADSDAALVIHDDGGLDAIAQLSQPRLTATELDALAALPHGPFPARDFGPADESFRVYSSGTTGKPKGIVHTHKHPWPMAAYLKDHLGIGPDDRVFCTSKLSFAYAQGNGFLGPLQTGATIILEPDWPSADWTLDMIERHRPTVVFSTPSLYRALLAAAEARPHALDGIRHFVSAGEALPVPLAEAWKARTGCDILNAYGCSETIALIVAQPPQAVQPGATGISVSGGELRLEVLDEGENGEQMGMLWIRHPFLASAYHGMPEQTAERFADGWFSTGDVFMQDAAGYLHHRGRQDGFIKVSGQWVQLRELEDVAAASDAITEAAAVVIKDEQGFARIALFIVPQGNLSDEAATRKVQASFEERAPRHRWPRWIRALPDLPRTSTGKIQTYRLRQMMEETPA